jgi:Mlc titration factor MtfA (ptsG expression regulator)
MDHYGATNPAEFFAVATETFFERPGQMAKHHEELFEILKSYYRIDPREWQSS